MSELESTRERSATSWTGLLAGAVAHDINNFVHGLYTASAAAERSLESLRQTLRAAADDPLFLDEHLGHLRKLGARLRVLAAAEESGGTVRIDHTCSDALAEAVPLSQQVLESEPIPADLRAFGTPAGVTAALGSLLDHALCASPQAAKVRLSIARPSSPGTVAVRIAADDAWTVGPSGEWSLDSWLATSRRDLRGDFSLVLAGAMATALGGAVRVATRPAAGLVLTLELVAVATRVGSAV